MKNKCCTKCNNFKELKEFNKDKSKKDGFSSNCKSCIKDKGVNYYKNNKFKIKECKIKYRSTPQSKLLQRQYRNKHKLKLKKTNPSLYNITHSISVLIYMSLKLKGYKKNNRTEKILGCNFNEFKEYIESKFEPWMNWDNHGKYTGNKNETWHIDHITPLSSAKTEEDIIKLNNYKNLQPLDSYINQVIKKDKY